MIIAERTLQQLDKIIDEHYNHDTEQGQHAIQTVQQIQTFIKGLEGQTLDDIIEESNPSNHDLKTLRMEIKESLERKRKAKLKKVLTLQVYKVKELVNEFHYQPECKNLIQQDIQVLMDELSDEQLLFTSFKVVTEFFEESEYAKLSIKGDE